MYFAEEKRSFILCAASTGSIPNIKKLGDWIYQDAEVFLQRKKDKYALFVNKCFNNYNASNNTRSKMSTI